MPDPPTRVCPGCSLVNPASAAMCDCGHVFDPAGARVAREAGFRPRRETHPPGPGRWIMGGAALLGFLLGAFPLFLIREIRAAVGAGGEWRGPALVLIALLGLSGMLVAVVGVLRWHAYRARKARAAG